MQNIYIGVDQSFTHTGVSIFKDNGLVKSVSILTNPDFFKFYNPESEDFKKTQAYKTGLVDDNMKPTKKIRRQA